MTAAFCAPAGAWRRRGELVRVFVRVHEKMKEFYNWCDLWKRNAACAVSRIRLYWQGLQVLCVTIYAIFTHLDEIFTEMKRKNDLTHAFLWFLAELCAYCTKTALKTR